METRAHFALIGLFTLAVAIGGFLFVFWISGPSKLALYQTYQLVVRGSVEGLTRGSAVMFNGLKVGEVTSLEIDPDDPSQVDVLINIDRKTPVKADTRARLEQRGFTSVGVVSLVGGTPGAPEIVKKPGEAYPRITAERSEIANLLENVQRLSGRAIEMVDKLDKLLDANSSNITATLKNVEAFTKTLADNSAPTGAFIRDAADVVHSLKPVASHLDGLIADADKAIKALDPKTIKSIAGNINKFSSTGLRQYEELAVDARKAVDSLDRAVRSIERDPSQVIFGPSQAVPEVQGR
ncbi:MlaD family protein [Methylocystis heyeri]|uniref:MCE family protein n=1 Tax=Methylocystis heyeri TaxID=391905 RepID=A0A6B8KJ30_9HYPH|nr:MlaD family protein [Methylocystis heyeri]QGM46915.1 MCE family protein [Methylocystis heyeri]